MRLTDAILKNLQSHPYVILQTLTIKDIASLIHQANIAYHSKGAPILTDDIYEIVHAYLEKLAPDHPLVQSEIGGAPIKAKERAKLPIWMGSMNKIKNDPSGIDRWRAKYPGEYIISDKLDGISCLFHRVDGTTMLYTRGDGTYGQNISNLLQYIQGIPVTTAINGDIMVRGELILPKAAWPALKSERNNPRNTVAGIANSKHPEPHIARLIHFVAYDCIEPRLAPAPGLSWLKQHQFTTVNYRVATASTINVGDLSSILLERRDTSPYEVDGIVINHNALHKLPEGENPPFAFAFKSILTHESAEVIVKGVQWNVSKNGLLKPVVFFDTVFISGVHIHRASAHNAQMIVKNGIGEGAKIIVIRSGDVIPYILSITTPAPAGPSLPNPIEYPWKWTDSGVDIVLKKPELASEYTLKQLINYTNVFGIKGIGSKLVKRLYEHGIDNIKKLANITKVDLYKATRSAPITLKIYAQLQNIYSKGQCIEFMDASNIFGGGLGQSKLKLITEAFPSLLSPDAPLPTLADLQAIKGIGERNARQFLEHIADFHAFMIETGLPCRTSKQVFVPTPEGCMSLVGKNITFTGFRSAPLTEYVEKHGGRVMSSVSASTHIVVAKSLSDDSMKSETARELGVPLMDYRTFEEEIGYVRPVETIQEEAETNEFEAIEAELTPPSPDEGDNDEDDETPSGTLNKTAECVRHTMNWSNMKRSHIFGKSAFNPATVADDLSQASPKLEALIKKIQTLDQRDISAHGRTFKHMIFSDVYKRGYGAKIIAAALIAAGFNHAYNADFKLTTKRNPKQKQNTFAVLASTQIYTKPITTQFKQHLLKTFNSRPDNTFGDVIRIIVLDTGYKEGIDLFDIKYVHLFEPMLTPADKMQAMGRAMRFCGQRGLHFEDGVGWKVHVYDYDHVVPQKIADSFGAPGNTSFAIIMNEIKKNERLIDLTHDIERVAQLAAVDRVLNRNVHPRPPSPAPPDAPFQIATATKYPDCKWPPAKTENLCSPSQATPSASTAAPTLIPEFSPSQAFIREYFQPNTPERGMLLWHSLGSGKTCTALATASFAWEANGYTILWVTRGTLRSDVYKNMFDMSCVERIRDYITRGSRLPEDLASRKRLLSKSWLPPVSFRQLNNTLKRTNRLFEFLVKRNGYADPFRKTLLIIDEAHLMLSPTMKEKDKPDVGLLKAWLHNSYKLSGPDSGRIILMSATPITDNPYDFMRLINLTSLEEIPETIPGPYVNPETLLFTEKGTVDFIEATGRRISYLNRMKDVRQFAQPVMHTVNVPISMPIDTSHIEARIERATTLVKELGEIKLGEIKREATAQIDAALEVAKKDCEGVASAPAPAAPNKRLCVAAAKARAKEQKDAADIDARSRVAAAKEQIVTTKENIKAMKTEISNIKKNDNSIASVLIKRCSK